MNDKKRVYIMSQYEKLRTRIDNEIMVAAAEIQNLGTCSDVRLETIEQLSGLMKLFKKTQSLRVKKNGDIYE